MWVARADGKLSERRACGLIGMHRAGWRYQRQQQGDAEVERILEESIEYTEQDFAERQLIEARNEAGILLTATDKSLAREQAEAPGEIPADERHAIDEAVAALREAVAGTDYQRIRVLVDALNQATMPLAERMMNRALATALEGKRLEEV